MTWHTVSPQAQALGESPFWHPLEHMLYWVDIVGKKILRCSAQGDEVQSWDMPSEPGCIAPIKGGGLVIALRHGIFCARQWQGELQHLATLDYDPATSRANDGRCDSQGRLWVGTVDETKTVGSAALYSVVARPGAAAQVQRMASDALTANGLAWSPDGITVYWADTPRHEVYAWNYEPFGNTMTNRRTFLKFAGKPANWDYKNTLYQGRPDGAAVDVQGNYYSAMYEGRMLCKFSPAGALLEEIPTPAVCPTMPCFGGPDMKTLYLTSARHGRSAQELQDYPQSGCVFYRQMPVAGLPVNFFLG